VKRVEIVTPRGEVLAVGSVIEDKSGPDNRCIRINDSVSQVNPEWLAKALNCSVREIPKPLEFDCVIGDADMAARLVHLVGHKVRVRVEVVE
jgi:hypothetical protein